MLRNRSSNFERFAQGEGTNFFEGSQRSRWSACDGQLDRGKHGCTSLLTLQFPRTGSRAEFGFLSQSSVFPDPAAPNFSRPASTVGLFGWDQKGLLATKMFERVAPRVLHAVLALPSLKYGPKPSGKLNRFTQTMGGVPRQIYIDFNGKLTELPEAMLVQV